VFVLSRNPYKNPFTTETAHYYAGSGREMPETRKILPATALILALMLSVAAGTQFVDLGRANPYLYTNCGSSFVTVSVLSPENKTYDTNSILVTIFAGAYPGVWYVGYSVDGEPFTELAPEKWDAHTFNESVWLNGLSKGSHNIVAEAVAPAPSPVGNVTAHSQVYFTITKILEPQSPSPSPTVTPTPTPTLTPQPTSTPESGPSLFLPTGALFGIAAIIGIGLLVYFKKRGKGRNS